jgi:hypothetical protein
LFFVPSPSNALPNALSLQQAGASLEQVGAVERIDLEGVVAKRLLDPYAPGTEWRKIRNPAYTQMEGRRDLFHPPQR